MLGAEELSVVDGTNSPSNPSGQGGDCESPSKFHPQIPQKSKASGDKVYNKRLFNIKKSMQEGLHAKDANFTPDDASVFTARKLKPHFDSRNKGMKQIKQPQVVVMKKKWDSSDELNTSSFSIVWSSDEAYKHLPAEFGGGITSAISVKGVFPNGQVGKFVLSYSA